MYVSPHGSDPGFLLHYDQSDVLAVQLTGKKTWALYEPPQKLARMLPWDNPAVKKMLNLHGSSADWKEYGRQPQLSQPLATHTMAPGDVLYVPRGTPPRASAATCHAHSHS